WAGPLDHVIAGLDTDRILTLWHPGSKPTRQRQFRLSMGSPHTAMQGAAVAFSPDGRYVAGSVDDGLIRLFRIAARDKLPDLPIHVSDAEELVHRPNAADALKPGDVSEAARAYVGGGDAKKAPPELVAVLGDAAFRSPYPVGAAPCSPAYS